jgi:putative ABC transport system permease protein
VRRYVWRDLVRNPRRTLASLVGVILGIGLFSGVLFFIDGSSATMTQRAIEPLALDMQRVLTSPLSGGLSLKERVSPSGSLQRGQRARITLTVINDGLEPANEVVVNDESPPSLIYLPETTTLDGRTLRDKAGQSPLAQGLARTGLNIGTVPAGSKVKLTYMARAYRDVADTGTLRLQGTISSREDVVPTRANAPAQLDLRQLQARISKIPGVGSVDGLSFVDLPPGSLRGNSAPVKQPVRVFGFDETYQEHYPSIRLASGSFRPGGALLSAEASQALAKKAGGMIGLSLPGRRKQLPLRVSGVVDLSQARPLFFSRQSTKLEDFLYVPNTVVVDPSTFENRIVPVFQEVAATRGAILKSPPVQEVDVLVDRSRLNADPASALEQTTAINHAIRRIAPGQDYLIDNISNTLQVASDDAAVAKRMFFFLGLPGVLLAAFLAAYAGSVLASAQRRDNANLRLRGAHRGHLRRMLLYRTLAFASTGSILGTGLGLLSVMAILGGGTVFDAAVEDLALSALVAVAVGMSTTAFAMYVPGRRSLSREVSHERAEMATSPTPKWARWRLDLILLAAAAIAQVLALRAGVFDAEPGSVYEGESASLPSHLMLAPLVAWVGGMLLAVRFYDALASRSPVPAAPRFGPLIRGTLSRSVKRRPWEFVTGILGVGLVIAFGVSLAIFTASYDAAKAADSELVVGSDLRVSPSPLSERPHPPSFASRLEVPGVEAVTPVAFKLENSVLYAPFNQDVKDLAAIDPESFERVAALSDSLFIDRSAADVMAALKRDPRGLLVDSLTADDLTIERGTRVEVLLARATNKQVLKSFRVIGIFDNFPGFPQGTHLVANLDYIRQATGSNHADFFLARAADDSHDGLAAAVAAIESASGERDPLGIETTETALDKDQSSLTALNVHGLLDLDYIYTLSMAATAIAIFVFGLMLHRRREYITLLAQGMRNRELRTLVMSEAGLIAIGGLAAGLLVGVGMAYLLVHVLRPLFILDASLTFPLGTIATLAGVAMAAVLVSALSAAFLLRRLRPTELLREA